MNIILTIGAFESLFLMLLLFTKKGRSRADIVLAIYFLILAIRFFTVFMDSYNIANNFPYPWLIRIDTPLIFVHGPIIWLFVKYYTRPEFELKWKHLIHILPFVAHFVLLSLTFYFKSDDYKINYLVNETYKSFLSFKIAATIWCVITPVYFIASIKQLIIYSKNIKNFFSSIEEINLNWVKVLLIGGLIGYTVAVLILFIDVFLHIISYRVFEFICLVMTMVIVLILGFYGHRQKYVFTDISFPEDSQNSSDLDKKDEPKELSEDEAFIKKLEDYMKKDKPYLDSYIDLFKLSNLLGVSSEYLSGILNDHLKKNFYNFINYYRVKEFKKRVADKENDKLTLIGIAYDVGFNSKATFNRVFKNLTNQTPGEYKAQIDKSI